MNYSLTLPDTIAVHLEKQSGNVVQQLKEALAVHMYNKGEFTEFQVRKLLGHQSRWDTDAFLKKHQCYTYSKEDLEEDRKALDDYFGKGSQ